MIFLEGMLVGLCEKVWPLSTHRFAQRTLCHCKTFVVEKKRKRAWFFGRNVYFCLVLFVGYACSVAFLLISSFISVLMLLRSLPLGCLVLLLSFFSSIRAQKVHPDSLYAYAWRGCMIDVSRHFFPVEVLQRQVDVLACYGINRLHLHLTDAGGWRFVLPDYPRLTNLAAWRTESDWERWWVKGDRRYVTEGTPGAYGGYYTEEELRQLVNYAAQRGIVVVPEVEVPGHSEELTAAYPQLKCEGNDGPQGEVCPSQPETYRWLNATIDHLVRVFPSPYIHIGGDEAGRQHWRHCKRCIAMAKTMGLKSTDELQHHIVRYAMQRVAARGRIPMCWDDALCEQLPANSIVMVWREVAAVQQAKALGYGVVYAPSRHCYLDYAQDAPWSQPRSFGGYLPLRDVWTMPLPEGILGVQGNLWTEYVATPQHLEYMLYPRMLAIAEVGRFGTQRPPYARFREWCLGQLEQLRGEGIHCFDLQQEIGDRPAARQRTQHKGRGAQVEYHRPPHAAYRAGGERALVDGWHGNWQHGDGRWQGFLGDTALCVTLDLQQVQTLRSVSMDFLQADGAGIYLPKEWQLWTSTDGLHFAPLHRHAHNKTPRPISFVETWMWRGKVRTRYLRIVGRTEQQGDWIFTDEIVLQ